MLAGLTRIRAHRSIGGPRSVCGERQQHHQSSPTVAPSHIWHLGRSAIIVISVSQPRPRTRCRHAAARLPFGRTECPAYNVQLIPVTPPVQDRLGSVQPEIVSAAAARTTPSATRHFIRDITNSIHEKKRSAREGNSTRSKAQDAWGFRKICVNVNSGLDLSRSRRVGLSGFGFVWVGPCRGRPVSSGGAGPVVTRVDAFRLVGAGLSAVRSVPVVR